MKQSPTFGAKRSSRSALGVPCTPDAISPGSASARFRSVPLASPPTIQARPRAFVSLPDGLAPDDVEPLGRIRQACRHEVGVNGCSRARVSTLRLAFRSQGDVCTLLTVELGPVAHPL